MDRFCLAVYSVMSVGEDPGGSESEKWGCGQGFVSLSLQSLKFPCESTFAKDDVIVTERKMKTKNISSRIVKIPF